MNQAIAQKVAALAEEMTTAKAQVSIPREHPNFDLAVRFVKHYNRINTMIQFRKEWENGTGYLDGICTDMDLQGLLTPGATATSVDPYMRKIILIGTRAGTVAVFQRYGHADSCDNCQIVHAPSVLQRLKLVDAQSSPLTWANANQIFGDFDAYNIGKRMEDMAQFFTTGMDPTGRRLAAENLDS